LFTFSSTDTSGGIIFDNYFGPSPTQQAKTFYIWHPQVNIGSTAKPYFPTTDRLNVPRLTYQNGGGGCPSLLLEKQSTNLQRSSEDFTNATYWGLGDITATANTTTSPDGTINADSIIENTANARHELYSESISFSGSNAVSFFIKANGRQYISVLSGGDPSFGGVTYDVVNGVITSTQGTTATISAMGNGWYKCTFTTTRTGTSQIYWCFRTTGGSPGVETYTGNGTSGFFIWGAQVEASSYPTSYISTTSASATRVADVCSKTGIGALIGGTSGTVFFDIKTNPTLSSANYKQFCYYFNAAAAQSYMFLDSANQLQTNSNWGSFVFSATPFVANTRYKVALTYAPNDFALYVNGVSVATASSGTPNDNVSIQIGQLNGSENCEFVFNQYTHFPSRLTNAELASLTTL
jgi:hypothetical protein